MLSAAVVIGALRVKDKYDEELDGTDIITRGGNFSKMVKNLPSLCTPCKLSLLVDKYPTLNIRHLNSIPYLS